MTLTEQIREHILSTLVQSAREDGAGTLRIRAGDVHRVMGLKNRMPAVCGALGAQVFQDDNGLTLVEREGPHQGANAVFVFRL